MVFPFTFPFLWYHGPCGLVASSIRSEHPAVLPNPLFPFHCRRLWDCGPFVECPPLRYDGWRSQRWHLQRNQSRTFPFSIAGPPDGEEP